MDPIKVKTILASGDVSEMGRLPSKKNLLNRCSKEPSTEVQELGGNSSNPELILIGRRREKMIR